MTIKLLETPTLFVIIIEMIKDVNNGMISIITRNLQETQTIRTYDIISSLISFMKNQIEDIRIYFVLGTGT